MFCTKLHLIKVPLVELLEGKKNTTFACKIIPSSV